jgi:hypothetical protein
VTESTINRRLRQFGWIAAALLLLFTMLGASVLLLTTRLVNLALGQYLPDNRAHVGSSSLSLGGTFSLRNVVIYDSGGRARQPLGTVHEIDVGFAWGELFERKLGLIRVNDVTLYARSDGHSQLSLIDLAYQLWRPSTVSGSSPFWIDTIKIHGRIRQEGLVPISSAKSDLPVALQITTFGERAAPSRHLTVAIGSPHQSHEQDTVKTPAGGESPNASGDSPFEMLADVETQSLTEGTSVLIHRLAAANAKITFDADTLRQYVAAFPTELHGQIETGLANLSTSGTVDLALSTKHDHLVGDMAFSGLSIRFTGDPKMTLNFADLSGAARVESDAVTGTLITIERLQAQNAKASSETDVLRRFVATLPPELHGRIETGLVNFSTSSALELGFPAKPDHLAGHINFSGLEMCLAGDPNISLSVKDLAGAATIASDLPLMKETLITITQLHTGHSDATVNVDIWRQYARKLPNFPHGSIHADFGALDIAGTIKSGKRNAMSFSGVVTLHDFDVHSSASSQSEFALDRLVTQANVDTRLDRWEPAAFSVHDGTTRWAKLSYGGRVVDDMEAAWHADGAILTFDRIAAKLFGGMISGAPRWDLAAGAIQGFDLKIRGIDAHQALANVAPARLDADGLVSGILHLALNPSGELSGHADLSFDGPGILRIGQIEELQRVLAGNFGVEMTNLAMHDLEHYPFRQGNLHLESAGANSELKIFFLRQIRTAADRTAPRREIINGREIWIGSLVVPKIDLTIPIAGKSFAEILSMVSGFHPLIESVRKQVSQ